MWLKSMGNGAGRMDVLMEDWENGDMGLGRMVKGGWEDKEMRLGRM